MYEERRVTNESNDKRGKYAIDLKKIPELLLEVARIVEDYRKALIWCSGSKDFGEGGIAREGWEKICEPLLR